MSTTPEQPKCSLCGELMPAGEEMFFYHGYSGPCPKPPLSKPKSELELAIEERDDWQRQWEHQVQVTTARIKERDEARAQRDVLRLAVEHYAAWLSDVAEGGPAREALAATEGT